MCAGTNGYYAHVGRWQIGGVKNAGTHHEGLEIRAPPLSETVSNFPVVINPVRRVELARITGWSQPIIQTALEAVQFIFAGF
jgi:hypothetical protein